MGILVASPSPVGFLVPSCETPGSPSGAYIGGLFPAPPGSLAFPLSLVQPILRAPHTVSAGGEISYTVTLANLADQPVPLNPCPTYSEELSVSSVHVTRKYRLNCDTVSSIPPHSSVTFAMVLRVPHSFRSGPARLTWGVLGTKTTGGTDLVVR